MAAPAAAIDAAVVAAAAARLAGHLGRSNSRYPAPPAAWDRAGGDSRPRAASPPPSRSTAVLRRRRDVRAHAFSNGRSSVRRPGQDGDQPWAPAANKSLLEARALSSTFGAVQDPPREADANAKWDGRLLESPQTTAHEKRWFPMAVKTPAYEARSGLAQADLSRWCRATIATRLGCLTWTVLRHNDLRRCCASRALGRAPPRRSSGENCSDKRDCRLATSGDERSVGTLSSVLDAGILRPAGLLLAVCPPHRRIDPNLTLTTSAPTLLVSDNVILINLGQIRCVAANLGRCRPKSQFADKTTSAGLLRRRTTLSSSSRTPRPPRGSKRVRDRPLGATLQVW